MKAMASVWFFVVVLVAVQEVFGNILCSNPQSCDQCLRCSGTWCSEPGNAQCTKQPQDSWCPNHKEKIDMDSQWSGKSTPGKVISKIYDERLALVGQSTSLELSYPGTTVRQVAIEVVNTTQNAGSIDHRYEDDCTSSNCFTTIKFQPMTSFCSSNATIDEAAYLKISFEGIAESAIIKYHIPCACGCSSDIEVNAAFCNGRGNFSCGVCSCNEGWTGVKCDQIVCPAKRGDMTCKPVSDELPTCSGNGKCGPCDTCICDTQKPGHQYLSEKDQCMDLCQIISYTPDVPEQIYNSTLGFNETSLSRIISIEKKNTSLVSERDDANRTKWMECTEIYNECTLRFVAKKENGPVIYVMVLESCNDREGGAVAAAPTVSILLAVLGIIAVVATVGGVLYWKHLNALPPVTPNSPGYVNIDAENCTCENPLYKSPTSNFKNPTYGKW